MPRASSGLLFLLALAVSRLAQAQPESFESEETKPTREGFAVGVGLGVALFSGSGEQSEARGGGGSVSLRLGTSAGKSLLWFVQMDLANYEQKAGASLLGIGAHYYFRETLWARGSLALASAVAEDEDGARTTTGGLALIAGIGADVYRRGIFAVDVEAALSRSGFEDGALSVALLQVAANWY